MSRIIFLIANFDKTCFMKVRKPQTLEPRVSIILICYNQEEYILEALGSIFIQEIPYHWELIIADDCSTDSTLELILKRLEKTSIPVCILPSEENLGLGLNMERAIEACRGEYIAVLEGDDYWQDPKRIIKHVQLLDANPEFSFSFNTKRLYYQEKKYFESMDLFPKENEVIRFNVHQLIRHNVVMNVSSCVFRQFLMKKTKYFVFNFDPTDRFWGVFMSQFGDGICINEEMTVYRINPNGIWSGKSEKEKLRSQLKYSFFLDGYFNFQYQNDFSVYRLVIQIQSLRKSFMILSFLFGKNLIRRFFYTKNLIRLADFVVFKLNLKF